MPFNSLINRPSERQRCENNRLLTSNSTPPVRATLPTTKQIFIAGARRVWLRQRSQAVCSLLVRREEKSGPACRNVLGPKYPTSRWGTTEDSHSLSCSLTTYITPWPANTLMKSKAFTTFFQIGSNRPPKLFSVVQTVNYDSFLETSPESFRITPNTW